MKDHIPILDWMINKALPLWATAGWDAHTAMFVECLDLSGAPMLDVPRRVMVQARQIYVYSTAHRHNWFDGAGELALLAANNMIDRFAQKNGSEGWIFSLSRDGRTVDARRDLYAHAFVLLGLAQAFALSKDEIYLSVAQRTLAFLDGHMASPHGGYIESWPCPSLPRRQNPHMHLLEALQALYEFSPSEEFRARADAIRALFFRRFTEQNGTVLVEFFDDEWHPLGGPDFPFEPGHHFEWIWLLIRHARLSEEAAIPSETLGLWTSAMQWGIDKNGLIFDEARTSGHAKRSTRLWPYAEAAKAACVMRASAPTSLHFLQTMSDQFLVPAFSGAWIDAYDDANVRSSEFVPASSFYHICCALDTIVSERKNAARDAHGSTSVVDMSRPESM